MTQPTPLVNIDATMTRAQIRNYAAALISFADSLGPEWDTRAQRIAPEVGWPNAGVYLLVELLRRDVEHRKCLDWRAS